VFNDFTIRRQESLIIETTESTNIQEIFAAVLFGDYKGVCLALYDVRVNVGSRYDTHKF